MCFYVSASIFIIFLSLYRFFMLDWRNKIFFFRIITENAILTFTLLQCLALIVLEYLNMEWLHIFWHFGLPITSSLWTIGVGLRMSTLDSNVAGSIPASICFLLEQETLSALLQSTQL